MPAPTWTLLLGFLLLVLLGVKPLGLYMARVFAGEGWVVRRGAPLERWIYRCCGIEAQAETSWRGYALGLLLFNLAGVLLLYPQKFPALSPDSAFNTAVSFVTNTNWQGYSGESAMSYLTQMAALAVQ